MLVELENKMRRQLAAREQPEAFLSSWRLFHFALRAYLINKLCDPEAMERLIASLPSSAIPNEQKRTKMLAAHVSTVESIEEALFRRYARQINEAKESELLTEFALKVAGLDLAEYWQAETPYLWQGYTTCAKYARHHLAHGKVFGKRKDWGKDYNELSEIMVTAFDSLRFAFRGDSYFDHVLMDGPLPPFVLYDFDSKSNRLIIQEDPDFILPEGGDV